VLAYTPALGEALVMLCEFACHQWSVSGQGFDGEWEKELSSH
jgi:hypothetical protein